jgi:predicted RecB family nuclease
MVMGQETRGCLDGLELAPGVTASDHSVYVPIRFVPNEKISANDKLLLAFDALLLSHAGSNTPRIGKLIHGREYATVTVPLTALYGKVRSAITSIAAQNALSTSPAVVLNKHCGGCEYESRCRRIALEKDDLSLISNMSSKERKKHHAKGIFTVTQLSYTFRPRRRPGRVTRHEHALKALAIRKNQIHVVGDCGLNFSGTPVYFDVEGVPDRDFYYLVGLRYESAGSVIQCSFWADDPSDESTMWTAFLRRLSTIEAPQLIHYGSYETTFLRRMKTRYATEHADLLDRLISTAVNLLSPIYTHVYFPTYSNRLKDVASYLGFRWSEVSPSGLAALSWRLQWEYSRAADLKQRLLVYNAEDCTAAQKVAGALFVISPSLSTQNDSNPNIVNVTSMRREYPQRFGQIDFAIPEFQQINDAAYWDHQRDKVYVRSSGRLKTLRRKTSRPKARVPVNKTVSVEEPRPAHCIRCGATKLYRFGRLCHVVYDLKLSSTGIKRWVVRYSCQRYICWNCKKAFHLRAHTFRYGNNICAYVAYQVIELHLPQNAVAKSMEQLFGLSVSRGLINHLKARIAERYERTYMAILDRIVGGKLVHADETRVTVAGKEAYVWVFTSLEEVAFVYSETREASTPQDVLKGFHGVLVTDFYAGYDSIDCLQQKCLIHLMRDINEDLHKQPFNDEMKEIARRFADLLKPIVASVDRFGLKAYHLQKHRGAVHRFFEAISERVFQTEVAVGYRKRLERNRDKLFTFLNHDGVPWNNNNAEHAIKAFVPLRNIIGGTSTAKGIREYLVLLSVSETCKCKGTRFLDFLLSEELDTDTFVSRQ